MKLLIVIAFASVILTTGNPGIAADGPSCSQLKTCSEAIEASEKFNLDTCLAGKSHEIGISLRGSIDIVKKAISGDLKANYDDAVRATSKLNDELQRPENAEIRECLKSIRSLINTCMEKATNKCLTQSDYPSGVDLLLQMNFKEQGSDVFDGNKIAISYLQPEHYENPAERDLNRRGWYADRVDMRAPPDGRFQGVITRVTKNSFDPTLRQRMFETPICLRWAAPPPAGPPASVAFYACNEAAPAGSCVAHPTDVGWLEQCPPKHTLNIPSLGFVSAAHAEPAPNSIWVVPSLNTLRTLRDEYLVGFTEFAITTTGPSEVKADRVALRAKVNGAELLVDGIRAENQAKPFVPGSLINFAFGVQTLNLDGRLGGCNLIEADILYFKDTELAYRHSIAQNFVAMRSVPTVERSVDGTNYRWTGTYQRPKQEQIGRAHV